MREEPQPKRTKRENVKHVLTVGDGNLSFSLALARAEGFRVTATTYDSETAVKKKYGEAEIEATCGELVKLGNSVMHGIDAMKINKIFENEKFDKIVFMHPLVPGCDRKNLVDKMGRTEHVAVIANRRMLVNFLAAARDLLRDEASTLEITIKNVFPYTMWRVEDLDKHVDGVKFLRKEISDLPQGYEARNLERDVPFALTGAETFLFGRGTRSETEIPSDKTCRACKVACTSAEDMARHENARLHRKRVDMEAAWDAFVATGGLLAD